MNIFKTLLFACLAMSIVACTKAPEGEKAKTGKAGQEANASSTATTYQVDKTASVINWEGTKPGGNHVGELSLKSGELSVKDGKVEAGEFIIDMNSMKCTDEGMPEDKKADLVGHLSNQDFFEVNKYPTAKFAITEVKDIEGEGVNQEITGNLTMKDTTIAVTFKANVNATDNGVTAEAPAFTIDRTKWGVNYGSPSALNVKDNIIHDEIGLKIQLVAK